jgi:predicted DNA repair protein MutK
VALIVKADDAGVALATNGRPASSLLGMRMPAPAAQPSGADRAIRPVTQGIGRGLVAGMPYFLKVLAMVGTAAMLWVGGGIILHGLEEFGIKEPTHLVHGAATWAAGMVPSLAAAVEWIVTAALSGVLGLIIGGVTIPLAQYVIAPVATKVMSLFRPKPDADPKNAAAHRA